jgi:hypothetical protein
MPKCFVSASSMEADGCPPEGGLTVTMDRRCNQAKRRVPFFPPIREAAKPEEAEDHHRRFAPLIH